MYLHLRSKSDLKHYLVVTPSCQTLARLLNMSNQGVTACLTYGKALTDTSGIFLVFESVLHIV